MSGAPERLRRQQFAFAAHLRDPRANPPPPDIEERRLRIYRELFYNNLEGLLAGNFPVIRSILPEPDWHALVRAFFAGHRCRTPIFPEIGREFVAWLEQRASQQQPTPGFLLELAHYEWVEAALLLDDADPDAIAHDPDGNLLSGVPLVSPLAWPLAYHYPVHRIRRDFQPDSAPAEPTFLLVLRDRDDKVRFKEISALAWQLLERLRTNTSASGTEIVRKLGSELQIGDPEAFRADASRLLRQLRERDAILGVRTQFQ